MTLFMKGASVGLFPKTRSGLRNNHIHGCTDVQQKETFHKRIVRTWVDQKHTCPTIADSRHIKSVNMLLRNPVMHYLYF